MVEETSENLVIEVIDRWDRVKRHRVSGQWYLTPFPRPIDVAAGCR